MAKLLDMILDPKSWEEFGQRVGWFVNNRVD